MNRYFLYNWIIKFNLVFWVRWNHIINIRVLIRNWIILSIFREIYYAVVKYIGMVVHFTRLLLCEYNQKWAREEGKHRVCLYYTYFDIQRRSFIVIGIILVLRPRRWYCLFPFGRCSPPTKVALRLRTRQICSLFVLSSTTTTTTLYVFRSKTGFIIQVVTQRRALPTAASLTRFKNRAPQ